ncbi:MAG: VOC family protein [Methylocystaceae bacterium]
MSLQLHHIGIAVSDLEQASHFYQQLGFVPEAAEPVELETRGVRIFFLHNDAGIRLELVEKPAPEASPYHLAYQVTADTLSADISALTADQWQLVPELGITNVFITGPGGERVELIRETK